MVATGFALHSWVNLSNFKISSFVLLKAVFTVIFGKFRNRSPYNKMDTYLWIALTLPSLSKHIDV